MKDKARAQFARYSGTKRPVALALAAVPLALALVWQISLPRPEATGIAVASPVATATIDAGAVWAASGAAPAALVDGAAGGVPGVLAVATPALVAAAVGVDAGVAETAAAERRAKSPINHVVSEGETLSDIADHYGISPDSIVWANDGVDDPHFLSVGQKLVVPPQSGILHTVFDGDTLLDVAEMYDVEMEEVAAANELREPYALALGQLLIVPGGRPPEPVEQEPKVLAMAVPERADTSSRGAESPAAKPAPAPAPKPAAKPVATVVPVAGLSAENAAFIALLVGPAQQSQRETGVPASVTIAQAIWEADWGRSGLAKRAHNYFGIKGRPNPGPAGVIWLETWEVINGRTITVREPFKVYNNLLESVLDHGRFIANNSRYAEAMKNRHDPKTFIRLVHRAGYATDPAYTDKIVRLLDRYNLYVYDL
ncbi:MAG: glucosaminidase domain-containing protein [Chloroflexota bacterium]